MTIKGERLRAQLSSLAGECSNEVRGRGRREGARCRGLRLRRQRWKLWAGVCGALSSALRGWGGLFLCLPLVTEKKCGFFAGFYPVLSRRCIADSLHGPSHSACLVPLGWPAQAGLAAFNHHIASVLNALPNSRTDPSP